MNQEWLITMSFSITTVDKLLRFHWGIRAAEFNGESVHKVGQTETIIAIFVGTLYKGYRGMEPFLCGTTTCHWYINNGDIPEIENFYNK
jgi:hypothetical protein